MIEQQMLCQPALERKLTMLYVGEGLKSLIPAALLPTCWLLAHVTSSARCNYVLFPVPHWYPARNMKFNGWKRLDWVVYDEPLGPESVLRLP